MALIQFRRLVFVVMVFGPAAAVAQPTSDDPAEGPWSGTAEVSLIATAGNSDTRTFGLGTEVTYDPGVWRWLGRISYVEIEADDQLKARSQSVLVEISRPLSERLDAYARGGYLRDLFAGIERRLHDRRWPRVHGDRDRPAFAAATGRRRVHPRAAGGW